MLTIQKDALVAENTTLKNEILKILHNIYLWTIIQIMHFSLHSYVSR